MLSTTPYHHHHHHTHHIASTQPPSTPIPSHHYCHTLTTTTIPTVPFAAHLQQKNDNRICSCHLNDLCVRYLHQWVVNLLVCDRFLWSCCCVLFWFLLTIIWFTCFSSFVTNTATCFVGIQRFGLRIPSVVVVVRLLPLSFMILV